MGRPQRPGMVGTEAPNRDGRGQQSPENSGKVTKSQAGLRGARERPQGASVGWRDQGRASSPEGQGTPGPEGSGSDPDHPEQTEAHGTCQGWDSGPIRGDMTQVSSEGGAGAAQPIRESPPQGAGPNPGDYKRGGAGGVGGHSGPSPQGWVARLPSPGRGHGLARA